MGRLWQVLGGLVGVTVVLGLAFVRAFRTSWAPVLDRVRRLNRRFTNPRVLAGGAGGPGASASVVVHHGRRTGQVHRTPVVAQPIDGGYVVALPYGAGADWVRNVLAAGGATLEHDGRTIDVGAPRVVPLEEGNPHFPAKEQRTHRRFGVSEFLLLDEDTAAR